MSDDVKVVEEKTRRVKEKKEVEQARRAEEQAQQTSERAQRAEALEQRREQQAEAVNLAHRKRTWSQVVEVLEYIGTPTTQSESPSEDVGAFLLSTGIKWYKKVQLATHPDKEDCSGFSE